MAGYSDVLDESTLALISEIDQVHRGQQQQDLVKYVNSLMSLGRHLQLQEFRSWLNQRCGLPIAEKIKDVKARNGQGKKHKIAWEHPPKSVDPATKETVYRFQGCPYEYDEDTTKVLEAEDVHQLIGLIFCKVYLTRFLQLTFKARRTQ